MSFLVNPYAHGGIKALIDHLTDLGLTSNLKLCLDAGDALSAPSSPTKWLDRSGNGYDFFMGTTGSAQSNDPTFNGSVGGLSAAEYWSFDGGDYFTYDTTNETWMQNLHKDNALFTFVAWIYIDALTGGVNHQIFATCPDGTFATIGMKWRIQGTGGLSVQVERNNSTLALTKVASLTIPVQQWIFVAVTLDEAAGTMTFVVNATTEADTGTYTSPSSSNASSTARICSADGADNFETGDRMSMIAVWEGVSLTTTQIDGIYQATRTRFNV